ncbi:glycosyltransferase [Leptolyngbya sp. FACHB-711]|nr:glycosyltransferase family 2 protein [Leptolyngbya sp. FACHB-711]MBD2028355.1 glycosyltransferase [Leptolyngbya sp. FACHB-711]
MSIFPRISIITPSYNQGNFIEETIQSVLSQNYPNLEYIVIDGGSTDNTIEIIKRYESKIAYWISEPDRGQAHAINKGLEKATGEVLAYINSDDYYLPGTLHAVADYFLAHPEIDFLHGRCCYVNTQGKPMGEQFADIHTFDEIIDLWGVWWQKRQFVQPEVFWTRRISDRIGSFNESLYFVMDYEYWCRILLAKGKVGTIDRALTCFRFTETQKSNQSEKVADELLQVIRPWLWDWSSPMAGQKRLSLQGQWLYQAILMKQIQRSVSESDPKLLRWIKSAVTVLQNPQILLIPGFHSRARQYFSRLLSIH